MEPYKLVIRVHGADESPDIFFLFDELYDPSNLEILEESILATEPPPRITAEIMTLSQWESIESLKDEEYEQ